jgi:N-acetylmuramoyl-L-alanine amidase
MNRLWKKMAERRDARRGACGPGRLVAALAAVLLMGPSRPAAEAAPRPLSYVRVGDDAFVRLADMARLYGLRLAGGSDGDVVLSSSYHSMIFEPDSRKISVMDVQVWLQRPVARIRGRLAVHRTDADTTIDPILRSHLHLRNRGASVVVIDAGHGGRDGGAESVVPGLIEKDATLDIAQRVRALLVRADVRALLTREEDVFLELDERCRIAARWSPDVFVSIHCNSGPDSDAQGVETYVLSKAGAASTNARDQSPSTTHRTQPGNSHDAASAVLGFALQKRLLRDTGAEDRGLRHARFAVLKDAPSSAALVECGFLSNRAEALKLNDPAYRDRLARSIAQGILDYCSAVRKAQISMP